MAYHHALDWESAQAAVLGGALLGGGGGGKIAYGMELARKAIDIGVPCLVSCSDLPPDAMVVTVSVVGAPTANISLLPVHYCRAVTMLQESSHLSIAGLITSENGAVSSINGWVQSALLQIPVVDAPCNGRAHPTGVMGSMGLHRRVGYISLQAAVGQNGLEVLVRAPLDVAAAMVRQAAICAGGIVAVARNPVEAAYVQQHAAPGAILQAISLGRKMMAVQPKGSQAVAEALAEELAGRFYGPATVEDVALVTEGGFDHGIIMLRLGYDRLELTFWNEYMTLERDGERLATFPDLIATLGMDGLPLSSAEIAKGQQVYVFTAPMEQLRLGNGVRDLALYSQVEAVIGKPVVPYLQDKPGFFKQSK